MSIRNMFAVIVVAAALVSGCSRILDDGLNPKYCVAHPTDPDCRREFPDAQTGCTSNAQCELPTAVCATERMTCVQCTAKQHDACTGTMPACGTDDSCRACSAHLECSSNACLPSGSCGDDTNVAYVDPSGTGTSCTKASPCLKVADALKTGRPFVKFQGTTNEQVSLNVNVTFLADPGAILSEMNTGIILKIDGMSQISIYDLEISGASGQNNPGISLQPGNTATVNLVRAKLRGNAGAGVTMASGTLNISQSTVSGNTAAGVSASGGTLTVSRSTIFSNAGGGISTSAGASFTITNNFIYHNGNTVDATAGGVGVAGISSDANKLEFNTIVDNLAGGGVVDTGGVFCDHAGFVAANNLIFRNQGGAAGNVQTLGLCTYGNSFVSVGTSNVDNTPMFVHGNSPPLDYHLTSTSPNTILDVAGQCTGIDFDGDTRPIGPACDLGADERKP